MLLLMVAQYANIKKYSSYFIYNQRIGCTKDMEVAKKSRVLEIFFRAFRGDDLSVCTLADEYTRIIVLFCSILYAPILFGAT